MVIQTELSVQEMVNIIKVRDEELNGTIQNRLAALTNPSRRKLTLFACACVRQIWHLLRDNRSNEAVLAAEGFVDGIVSRKEMTAKLDLDWEVAEGIFYSDCEGWFASMAASYCAYAADEIIILEVIRFTLDSSTYAIAANNDNSLATCKQHQLFDDIFGVKRKFKIGWQPCLILQNAS